MNEEEILNEIDFCLAGEYITMEHRQAIEGLLDLYNQEKEKNKKLEEIIDMMAEDISEDFEMDRYCDWDSEKLCCPKGVECKDCIKEYYFNKVRGEENENT